MKVHIEDFISVYDALLRTRCTVRAAKVPYRASTYQIVFPCESVL